MNEARRDEIEKHYSDLLEIIELAYPDGLKRREAVWVAAILVKYMTHGTFSTFASYILDESPHKTYNDIPLHEILSRQVTDEALEKLAEVKLKLDSYGFADLMKRRGGIYF